MKKKIGFIDLYIDEWHANHYPEWIRGSKLADQFEIHMAWERESRPGLRPLAKWCEDFQVTPARSQEELIEKCDCLIVLAPSNPEVHESLADQALKSGKRLYMDKPFAPDKAAAGRIFELAAKHNTPMFSSSALRFTNEIAELKRTVFKDEKIEFASATGSGSSYWEYCIHMFEMIATLLGPGAVRLMQTSAGVNKHVVIEYNDGRVGTISYAPEMPYQFIAAGAKQCRAVNQCSNFFPTMIETMLEFFNGAPVPVPHEETLEIAAMVGQSIKAQDRVNTWFEL